MKKQILLTALLLFFGTMLHGQSRFYRDSIYTAPFQRLVGATPVDLGTDTLWDDPTFSFPLGFTFKVFNDSSNTIYNDAFSLGSWLSLQALNLDNNTMIIPSTLDLINKSANNFVSPISYQTIGNAPNRICKLEYRNVGLYDDVSETDSMDMQVWFYEKSDIMEFRYGNVNIQSNPEDIYYSSGDGGDFIGIIDSVSLDTINQSISAKKSYFEIGNPTSPILDSTNALNLTNVLPGLDTNVSSNLVMRLIPVKPVPVVPTNVYNVDVNNKIQFTYTPLNQSVTITNNSNANCVVSLLNSNGALIEKRKIGFGISNINLSNLPSSIYFVHIQNTYGLKQVYKISK